MFVRKKDVTILVKKGKFITLEGVDGSGISTQTSLLQTWMLDNVHIFSKTYFTKEPTTGPVGSLIQLALAKRLKPLDERIMALLFAADRIDHLYCSGEEEQKEGIITLLEKGINVVSDRYYLSSYAYQSSSVDLDWVREINRYSIKPDLTILLKVPVQASTERRNLSRIHEELYEKEDYLARISHNYERTAKALIREGENILILDGNRNKDEVFSDIQRAVATLFQSKS